MARPRVPRISRRKALEAALHIIDSDGLDALSMRRLGDALKVNKASLYHHFKNKDAIVIGATELALAEVTAPRNDSDSWRVWMPLNAYLLRSALIAHPELISIMLRRVSLGIGRAEVEAAVARLREEGVAEGAIVPLMESLEMVAIVSALQVVSGRTIAAAADSTPTYSHARTARELSDEEQFEVILAAVMSSVESAVSLKVASRTAKSAHRRVQPPVQARPRTSTSTATSATRARTPGAASRKRSS